MEDMGVITAGAVKSSFWGGRRVLITGHTGFKGGWLSLWLQSMGAVVHGVALPPPTQPSLFVEGCVAEGMTSALGDIRDFKFVFNEMNRFEPEIVIHMAAQPLVRYSYIEPVETYATNVMGTVHVLEAVKSIGTIRAIINVTTDKCYENREWVWGYREDEPMGGHDPYSSSKGCSELVSSAYRKSFFQEMGIQLATVRAGNVIGGGDWALDRLVPDVLKAFNENSPVVIRNPRSIRPWQHVLEPLSGYLVLAQALCEEGNPFAEAWNFGPNYEDAKPVEWVVNELARLWDGNARWERELSAQPHEAHNLRLDIAKANTMLRWRPRWNLERALQETVSWHKLWIAGGDVREKCIKQINDYQRS